MNVEQGYPHASERIGVSLDKITPACGWHGKASSRAARYPALRQNNRRAPYLVAPALRRNNLRALHLAIMDSVANRNRSQWEINETSLPG